ncbi:enoyl- hydratase [Trichoderma arundinaceum]|uniref:Enoyl-hydratase n=1 Tax=Trichoderma arundinaceum TaxID=490622 RepID=A0A395NHI4_TRIAR|nr:enoyl- hydratase [Trichoderma arundinaceum]
MAAELPSSYSTFTLPTLQFSHHPASSSAVTPVIIIKLHRPSAHNAFTQEMARSLITAYSLLSSDPRVRAIVVTSSDPKNKIFCAGMDFNARGESSPSADEHRDEGGQVSLALYRCSKPVIVAINGSAVGVGITMTLPANIRVVSKDAKIGFVFSQRGFCLEACSSFFLPRLIGTSKALHLATTGSVYPAGHKLFDGLFSEVVEADQVLPTALKIADEIARNVSLVSATVMKNQIYRTPASPEEAHLLESKMFYSLVRSKDAQEGIQSFLQKRQPEFKDTIDNDAPPGYPWWAPVDVRSRSKL